MHVLDLFNDKERKFLNGGPLEEAEVKTGMSRAAKGHEKYGKKGMQALAKAGREGASEKKLDAIRDRHDKYDESVAGPENCWPRHRKVGTKPGTGKNAGKRVNDCEKIKEDDVAEATGDVKFDKILKGITNKKQVAKQQKADTKQQARDAFGNMFGGGNPADKLSIRKKDVGEGMLDNPGEPESPVAQAIVRRILLQRTDLLAKYGPDQVSAAVDEVADFVGDVDEIGSSDVSGWVRHVEQMLGNMQEGVAEGSEEDYKNQRMWDQHDDDTKDLGIIGQGEHWAGIHRNKQRQLDKEQQKKDIAEAGPRMVDQSGNEVQRTSGRTVQRDAKPRELQTGDSRSAATGIVTKTATGIRHVPYSDTTPKPRFVEQGVAEGSKENNKPRIRKYSKMRPDGSKSVRYEVLDYQGRRVSGQGTEGFDDPKNAKEFYYRNYDKLQAPVEESTVETGNNEQDSVETIGMKESSRYWCKDEKRWKDNK
jgi:hypothetical protein